MAQWTLVEATLADRLQMRLYIAEHEGAVWSASLHDDEHPITEDEFLWRLRGPGKWERATGARRSEVLADAAAQIGEYFSGRRVKFQLPLSLRGTAFQVRVWRQLTKIPFGATRSYAEIAEAIEHPAACRAVGNANGRNNLPVLVPCHRVLATGGKLGGFTGGLGLKRRLLDHEARVLGKKHAA